MRRLRAVVWGAIVFCCMWRTCDGVVEAKRYICSDSYGRQLYGMMNKEAFVCVVKGLTGIYANHLKLDDKAESGKTTKVSHHGQNVVIEGNFRSFEKKNGLKIDFAITKDFHDPERYTYFCNEIVPNN